MNTRLTVLQVLPALEDGGVERGTLELAAELARRDHRPMVISGGGRLVSELIARGGEHYTWPIDRKSPLTLRLVRRMRRFLQEQGVDILHVRSRLPAWVAYLAWRTLPATGRPRFVTTVHGLYSKPWYSTVMTRGERVIAVSETVRDHIRRTYPRVEPERVRVIHRGIDTRRFPPDYQPSAAWLREWYRTYPGFEGKFLITLPGRLTRVKGHRDFLEVMARLRERGLSAHGLVVGGEDRRHRRYADALREEAGKRALDVTFTGRYEDMREVYAISNAVVSLSRKPESFGRTVLEALSLGTPVIGYDHGGVGEILQALFPEGRVPVGDVEAVVGKLAELIRRPRRVSTGGAFPLEDMLERTLALYSELAQERVGRGAGNPSR